MDTGTFGVYENRVSTDAQQNKVKATLCALSVCVSSVLLCLLDILHSSHVFLPCEPTSYSPANSHYSVSIHITSAVFNFITSCVSCIFLIVKAATQRLMQRVSLLPDPTKHFPVFPTKDRI